MRKRASANHPDRHCLQGRRKPVMSVRRIIPYEGNEKYIFISYAHKTPQKCWRSSGA